MFNAWGICYQVYWLLGIVKLFFQRSLRKNKINTNTIQQKKIETVFLKSNFLKTLNFQYFFSPSLHTYLCAFCFTIKYSSVTWYQTNNCDKVMIFKKSQIYFWWCERTSGRVDVDWESCSIYTPALRFDLEPMSEWWSMMWSSPVTRASPPQFTRGHGGRRNQSLWPLRANVPTEKKKAANAEKRRLVFC